MFNIVAAVGVVFILTACSPSGGPQSQDISPSGNSQSSEELPVTSNPDGTRDNPYPMGTTIFTDDWQVTINDFTKDATDAVLAEWQYNKPDENGLVYSMVNLTYTYLGEGSGTPLFDIRVNFVGDNGIVYESPRAIIQFPEEMDSMTELYKGGTLTGNEGLAIPVGEKGLIRIKIGLFRGGEAFFLTE